MDVFIYSIKQLKNYGLNKIIISGGEPTLRDDLEFLLREIKENISIEYVCLITNGIHFPEKLINVVKKYVDEVSVSIDGYNENISFIRPAGIYSSVIDTVRVLKENEINVSMIVTLHKQNMEVMNEYKLLSEKLEVPFSYSILVCNNKNRDECKEFEFDDNSLNKIKWDQDIENTKIENFEFATRLSCEAGRRLLSIAANGDVFPCHMLHDECLKFGNINDMSIPEILISPKRLLFKFITVDFIKECSACKFRYLCGGGCRANAYYKNGDLLSKDPYCLMYYNFYNTILDLLKQQNLAYKNISREELNEKQIT
ncbi:Arylsulfatase regulator (Fe-S oxidoreductase)-like protein [Caldicellulosiruptor saccharolyticus DSM 8903]|uniref:Arylsulfatase regulator (Fe-S oxidoreductase)-like protein n=1 Tax=Caldicellulosiruptor saccharolyticus (strain ATCC 43494 / DSM 8903 / Tp8T 6331) TaxID=351627 RepID=A4XH88_CALS8|nr:radical SAM/SPASM domain-containing protein [Caldicellulosiruptor saccharolyticus]ABP66273.1 Arylsulfatase regulator (Fe-S oxidoreductase)-like protein [Caldicellulosiruptor saccharolyticus DSM 8903]